MEKAVTETQFAFHSLKQEFGLERMRLFRRLVLVTLIGLLVTLLFPSLINNLGIPSGRSIGPQHFYSLLTHPLAQGGLMLWLWSSFQILLIALFITRAFSIHHQLILILSSMIAGGLAFEIFGPGSGLVYAGSGMIISGMMGAFVIWGVLSWRPLHWFPKLCVAYSILSFAMTPFVPAWRITFLFPAGAGVALAMIWLTFKPRPAVGRVPTGRSPNYSESGPSPLNGV